ncbi:ribulose-phosphate 3-epimerase [Lactobacillus crispatus]|uniref:Ribulose-phosphate 3-epimerase n=1 Tax=Ligilactobacillus salivarius TaxID=1624 RepID=A0A921IC17_9LACO|nr:ribulose-phosphate 3-epimerase [Lactobacillus crispatus]HJG15526.1 ribulose-phosphate 3-epimerase [Ligilactobacillus salivarius]
MQIEIHLMSNNLEQMIPLFVKTGCDLLEFHIEVSKDNTSKWIKLLKQSHIKSGIVLKPSTPVSTIAPYLNSIDQLLLMTVTPGFGGQKFQSDSSDRIKQAKTLIIQHNTYIPIEVDGGINNETVRIAKNAGADIFVAGSYIYNQKSISNQIRELKSVIE